MSRATTFVSAVPWASASGFLRGVVAVDSAGRLWIGRQSMEPSWEWQEVPGPERRGPDRRTNLERWTELQAKLRAAVRSGDNAAAQAIRDEIAGSEEGA
jgi:hypothetical protein